MPEEIAKAYEPQEVEDKIYEFWQQNRWFHAVPDSSKKPYTIVIPPPNITGQLHMGHALDETLQDILIRWRRMQGYSALWLPGTDHAAIATEAKIVAAMAEEGVTKEDLGREGFLERAWQWKDKYGSRIVEQLKKLGSSCDWERERFTMDEGCSKAVKEVFVRLYEKGLIYRGERIINWCPKCKTSLSDAEVEFDEKAGSFWHLRYHLTDGSGYLDLATTRPETLLGDTALAVHPDDERYKSFVGKTVTLPLVGREIPVVADSYVEPEFGTGVVKITPAHDPNDFEVGLRHKLPVINVLNEDATINEQGGKYEGLDRYECRKAIVKDLEQGGFLLKIEPHNHNVGGCYRCGTTVEPRVSTQWFVKMEPLAKPAIQAVKEGQTKFVPERFDKIYFHWLENIRDWCISRQIWWGHRIPAWYCQSCGKTIVSREEADVCPHCKSASLEQDTDTLDTWFSSALWPFSTLGWPDKTEELKYFYPTNTLVTGYDIIFFWVVRMMFSGLEHTGEVPFNTVFIHGIVRDSQGRKMSKSLGNGIDPLVVIQQYGADALRFSLTTGVSPGNDMRFTEEKVESSRNFANKLWNATRFVLMNLGEEELSLELPTELALEDKWIISTLNATIREVTNNLENFELGIALQKVNDFVWESFCDWYIELSKARLQQGGETAKSVRSVLIYVLTSALKLLHPFMPYITEALYQSIPHNEEAVIISKWPEYSPAKDYPAEAAEMGRIMAAIRAIRTRRSEMNVPPSKKAKVYIDTAYTATFENGVPFLLRLASASEVEIGTGFELEGAVNIVTDVAKIYIPMAELVDKAKELERLNKELEKAQKDFNMISGKLNNQGFVAKAPASVVEAERAKLAKIEDKIELINSALEKL
ncbi:MAG: valine--tRNA ligase [Oscillospiraceae bacterium]|jgi:valyl-tRNA synthetase|nr:valine--tRNA ligase [Oscillospiraceae bacterium]